MALANPSDKASVLALRTVADASSVNCHGKVDTGWLLGKVDLAASLVAERLAADEVTTVRTIPDPHKKTRLHRGFCFSYTNRP